jgi:hypothetical protein
MTDETLYAFLARRDRELTHQIAALKGQIAQLTGQLAQRERELDKVRKTSSDFVEIESADPVERHRGYVRLGELGGSAGTPALSERYAEMTIKELVIQALLDHYTNGATTIEIRDFIQDAYGRDIMPSSLRPQMHRLKADGILSQDPTADKWNFTKGKRGRYKMYDHPSSRKALKELRDEPPEGLSSDQITDIEKSK